MIIRRLLRDHTGNSAIQFAFIAPTLILLTLGIVDMGRLGLAASSLRSAAIEAARFASVRGASSPTPATTATITQVARDQAVGVPAADMTVAVTWTPNNKSGGEVKVELRYPVKLFISSLIPLPTIQLDRSSQMLIF